MNKNSSKSENGDTLRTFLIWLLLLFFCWPLAWLAIVLYPVVWLILLPFRLIGITVEAVFDILAGIIKLPGRILNGKRA